MLPDHLLTAATLAALVWSLGATSTVLYRPRQSKAGDWLYALVSLSMLCGVLALDAWVSLGRNSFFYIMRVFASGDLHHLCAAAFGASIGALPVIWRWMINHREHPLILRLLQFAGLSCVLATFFFLALLAAQDQIKPYVQRRGLGSIVANPAGFATPSGFQLDQYHDCGFFPVQIAVGPQGDLFASGYWGAAFQDGVVAKISRDATNLPAEMIIARNLGRPHGIAFHDGQLYVSRCGQYVTAKSGALHGVPTGAVTQLRDLDGDGMMDYFSDILADLPGAQGPDPLHQNNGITFAPNGDLFVTVGAHSDRAPATSPLEGTIVRLRSGTDKPEVFARGLRNPFDIVVGPQGELFATDNDASRRHNGDELNHIREDGHYGHPYADGSKSHPDGTISPLAVMQSGTFEGLAYTESTKLPEAYRNCLYVVSYGNGEIIRVRLQKQGDTYQATTDVFARIPNALDIAIDDNGVFYISCFEDKKIYRLHYRGGDS